MAIKRSTSPTINTNSENILRFGDSGRSFVSARNVVGRIEQNRSAFNTGVNESHDSFISRLGFGPRATTLTSADMAKSHTTVKDIIKVLTSVGVVISTTFNKIWDS